MMKRKLSTAIVCALCATGFVFTLSSSPFLGFRQSALRAQTPTPPILIISTVAGMPTIAAHIADAQFNRGYPILLNRIAGNDALRRSNNRAACRNFVPAAPPNTSCDEYPFASTYQGGAGSSTRAVPLTEQRIQGGTISSFYQNRNIPDRGQFMVLPAP
jgi:hypothetical protein